MPRGAWRSDGREQDIGALPQARRGALPLRSPPGTRSLDRDRLGSVRKSAIRAVSTSTRSVRLKDPKNHGSKGLCPLAGSKGSALAGSGAAPLSMGGRQGGSDRRASSSRGIGMVGGTEVGATGAGVAGSFRIGFSVPDAGGSGSRVTCRAAWILPGLKRLQSQYQCARRCRDGAHCYASGPMSQAPTADPSEMVEAWFPEQARAADRAIEILAPDGAVRANACCPPRLASLHRAPSRHKTPPEGAVS